MTDKKLRETIIGKYSRYDIYEKINIIAADRYYVYKDGRPHKGPYRSFQDAVNAATKEG